MKLDYEGRPVLASRIGFLFTSEPSRKVLLYGSKNKENESRG